MQESTIVQRGIDYQGAQGKCRGCYVCFGLRCTACRVLFPQPGIEPMSPAVEVQSPNPWTTRELPAYVLILIVAIVSWMYTLCQNSPNCSLQYVWFIVCQLYPNKAI